MPTCHLTLSEGVPELSSDALTSVRDIVAEALDSGARHLDKGHIVIRVLRGTREHMLADVEIEVFCQFFLRRFFSRDRRAQAISSRAKDLLNCDCASWINMMVVGYSRVTRDGSSFFSDKTSQAPVKPAV